MLACLRRRTLQEVAAGDMYSDGTLAVDSMTAVWVITTFGKAFRRRLVRLSDVDPDSLRSVGSVAKLIKQTTASLMAAGAA
jgi:acyl carrier protein